MSGLDDRPVAGDVGHRAEHVEGLCPGDARDRVHRERGDALGLELLEQLGGQRGSQQAGEHGARLQLGDLSVGRRVDLDDEVAAPDLTGGGDGGPGLFIGMGSEAGQQTSP